MQRALSNIRDSILNKNVTVTMTAFPGSLCPTSPGKKSREGKGSQREPVRTSRPGAS